MYEVSFRSIVEAVEESMVNCNAPRGKRYDTTHQVWDKLRPEHQEPLYLSKRMAKETR
jgi:hypothetical protein